ncbi:MAG TPA: radical SAM protein [Rhodospirillaceae bacterium]|nr:radical SAM protein [Rhodospirillaceae bacterium]
MPSSVRDILYVRLPCWKIYPGGLLYVADYIHKCYPEIRQHILDFAVIDKQDRRRRLIEEIQARQPDIVAFSWRNMQSFGPNPDDDALDVVMDFLHSRNPFRRLRAAFEGLSILYEYMANRINNFRYMRLVRRMLPQSRIVVGGTAVSVFGPYVAKHCPADSFVVVGEGQDAMLSVVEGCAEPLGEVYHKDRSGNIHHYKRKEEFDLRQETSVDFPYIESIFPDFHKHLDSFVGVHTKRGCPYNCHFCLYNKIEGARQRYREPVEVVDEVEVLNKRYGVKKIWFTDAQFCSTKASTEHMEQILDLLLERQIDIQWTGYIRLTYITPYLAKKMIDSGLASLDLSFTGSQEMVDALVLAYRIDEQMETLRMFRDGGYAWRQIKLYLPLNAPGETAETLRQTILKIKELYDWFGRDNVLPFIFFIGIQPGTPIEADLKEEGYLAKNYNPLTYNPFTIMRLLYNPNPLGEIIARAYLEARETLDPSSEYIGRATLDILERELFKPAIA